MSDVVDRLEVKVEAEAQGANKQLDKLVGNLERVSSSLGTINAGGLQGLANGVQKLSNSMLGMKNVGTADFTRLTKNIGLLDSINTKGLNSSASSMIIMEKSLNGLGKVSENAVQLGELSKSIAKLGNKGVTNAITNIPQLADALNKMMGTLSRSPQVSKNLIQMTNSLASMASQGSKVSSATNSINGSLKSYVGATDTATKSNKSFASSIGMLYARFWMLKRAAQAMFKSVESSMDFLETVNYFEVAVGKIGKDSAVLWQENGYNSAEEYANSFSGRLKELTSKMTGFNIDVDGNATMSNADSLGLNPDKVMQNQAVYAQMADSLGLVGETAINTSKAFTMLGADWASLRNISLDTAWEKFASAMAGQSRAVRSLGIDITMATLQETAYKYGLTQAVQEMNQATKAQLRLLTIMNQSTVAFGDMANTIQSPANQLRVLQQNFANLSRIIGNLFLPVIAKVLPYINGLVIAMQRLFTWVGGLLGIKFDSINSAIGGAVDGIGDMVGGVGDLEEGLEDANTAAKKLKTTTLGIDELNINAPQEDSGGGSGSNKPIGGGSGILDTAIEDALAEYEKVWDDAFNRMDNKAKTIADNIANYFGKIWKASENTRGSLKNLWNGGFKKLEEFSGKALIDFYDKFLTPVGKWALGKGLPNLINHLNSLLKEFNWNKLQNNLNDLWDGLAPFTVKIGDGLIEFFKDMMSFGTKSIDFISQYVGYFGKFLGVITDINPALVEGIGYSLGVLLTAIIGFNIVTSIADKIVAFGGAITTAITAHPYLAIAAGIAAVVMSIYGFHKAFENQQEIEAYGDTIENLTNKLDASSDAIKNKTQEAQAYVDGAGVAEMRLAQELSDKYYELADKENKTNAEKELMKQYSTDLIGLIPQLSEKIDEETGFLNVQKGEVQGLIDKTQEYYKLQAARDEILEAYKRQMEAEKNLLEANKLVEDATRGLEKANRDLTVAQEASNQAIINGELDSYADDISDAQTAVEKHNEALETFKTQAYEAGDAYSETTKQIDYFNEIIGGTQGAIDGIDFSQISIKTATEIDAMGGIWDNGKQIIGQKALEIQDEMKKMVPDQNGIYQLVSGMSVQYGNTLDSEMKKAVSTIDKPLLEKMRSMLPEGYTIGQDSGKYYVDGFNNGVSGKSKETENIINKWCNTDINEATKSALDIHSPSGISDGFGQNYVIGFNQGVEKNVESTLLVIDAWANQIVERLNNFFGENFSTTLFETAFSADIWTERLNVWFESITPFFTLEKWELLLSNTVLSFTNSWDKISKESLKQLETMGVTIKKSIDTQNKDIEVGMQLRLKNWGVSWESMNITVSRICDEIQKTIKLMSKSVKEECDNVITKLDEVSRKIASIGSGTAKVGVSFNVPQFAGGGFPDTGELFMARENGITEMVGSIGSKPAVANNDQIVEGIASGVTYANEGVIAELRKQNALLQELIEKDSVIEMDSREVGKILDSRRNRNGLNFSPA